MTDNGYDYPRGDDWDVGIAWKEAGVKIVVSDNVTMRNNIVRRNDGMGLWTDDDVRFVLIEGNTVTDHAVAGILIEKSYVATVRNNTSNDNGTAGSCRGRCGGVHGAGVFVQNSSDVEIHDNVARGNNNGITVLHQNRGSGQYGLWDTRRIHVHRNTIEVSSTAKIGFSVDTSGGGYWNLDTVCYDYNVYTAPNGYDRFWWSSGGITWNAWRGVGQDPNGTFNGNAQSGTPACS